MIAQVNGAGHWVRTLSFSLQDLSRNKPDTVQSLSNGSTSQTYHKTTFMQAKTNADNAKPDVVLRRF